jgi:hypothetical protein
MYYFNLILTGFDGPEETGYFYYTLQTTAI